MVLAVITAVMLWVFERDGFEDGETFFSCVRTNKDHLMTYLLILIPLVNAFMAFALVFVWICMQLDEVFKNGSRWSRFWSKQTKFI